MNDDAALLSSYVEKGSEQAFTALVQKHVDLVYSAALRRTGGDSHRAADVAQHVFTALARQAHRLTRHPALGAWLHATTRNIAVNLKLSDQRRERRQHIAFELAMQSSAPTPEWEKLRPVLDSAIDELPERDRLSVVMRFLEQRPFKEIGIALKISEDAARIRTDRAVARLREALERRGITSTTAALSSAISTYATVGAPEGLAAALAVESLAAAGGSGVMAAATTFLFAKFAATAAISALVAFAVGMWFNDRRTDLRTSTASATQGTSVLSEEKRRLEAEIQRLSTEVNRLNIANSQWIAGRPNPATGQAAPIIGAPLPRHVIQTSVLNNLRQLAGAQDQFRLEYGRWPTSISELVGADNYVKRLVPVDGEDYFQLLMGGRTFRLTTASGITVAYANDEPVNTNAPEFRVDYPPELVRARELHEKVSASKQAALEAYRVANQGKDPGDERALLSFFATPQQGADFIEFLEARKAAGLDSSSL